MSGVYVFGTPVSVGHVHPLIPLARALVQRGDDVVWAISGDANEPASHWRDVMAGIGAQLVDLDKVVPFTRGDSAEINDGGMMAALFRRISARANDIAPAATEAIRAAVGGRPIRGAVHDYFALWAYATFKRLGVRQIDCVITAFPTIIDEHAAIFDLAEPYYQNELAKLTAAGFGTYANLRGGLVPDDPALRVFAFTSPHLCKDAPPWVRLLGIQPGALQWGSDVIPEDDRALVARLGEARARGERVVLLSMGTVVMRLFARAGQQHVAFLRRLYSEIAAAALRAGAVVIASTSGATPEALGIDEATLGPSSRDRVWAMPFVPQKLLFAHGLVDLMLMHGGANTFHETVLAGIPTLISPGFGDQLSVARAVTSLGVGVALESTLFPSVPGALTIAAGGDLMPAMLAPENRWRIAAGSLAEALRREDGVAAALGLLS